MQSSAIYSGLRTAEQHHKLVARSIDMEGSQEEVAAPDGQRAATSGNVVRTSELTVDDIIEEHVGPFGFSQVVHVLLLSMARVFDSQITLVTIFSDAQPAWECTGSSRSASSCPTSPSAMCGMEPGSWEWVGGNGSSIIAEWGLVCGHKFRAGLPASMFFLGCIIGSGVYGRLADTCLGRKKTVLLTCLLTSITALLTSFSPNIWVYAVLRFLGGFARAGIGICSLVLATEAVGRKWRGQVGQYGFFFFTMGFLFLPLIAYPTRRSWRTLYRVLAGPPFVYSLLFLPFISESPRWLAVKGKTDEALRVLKKFGSLNGKKLPDNVVLLTTSAAASNGSPLPNENIWSSRWAARRMLLLMITGFGIGLVYYGIQLNVENLSFNLYFAVAVNAMMEIPAVFVGGVFLSFMDRRILYSSASVVAGFACAICIPFIGNRTRSKSHHSWAQLVAEALGFMASSTAFSVLYIYCVELFPTQVRNFAVSMLRQACMLGAAVAPVLVVLGRVSPALLFVVFAVFALFSAVLIVWLPETRKAPLYETLEQQQKEEKLGATADPEVERSQDH